MAIVRVTGGYALFFLQRETFILVLVLYNLLVLCNFRRRIIFWTHLFCYGRL